MIKHDVVAASRELVFVIYAAPDHGPKGFHRFGNVKPAIDYTGCKGSVSGLQGLISIRVPLSRRTDSISASRYCVPKTACSSLERGRPRCDWRAARAKNRG